MLSTYVALSLFLPLVTSEVADLPSSRGSSQPVHVYEGDDALITCVVRSLGGNTVLWKKEEEGWKRDEEGRARWKVLTAGHARVTMDKRVQVIHDQGGEVWVLAIKNSTVNDSGLYTCEVNSVPKVQSFHKLQVLSKALMPPTKATTPEPEPETDGTELTAASHNYTDCCIALKVSSSCLGFCNIQSILEGNTGQDPENCEQDFPAIVRCMADGRNHVPCCIEERVPDICQDICRGEYTVVTDNVKTHFSCSAYTEQTLACIVEGVEILPSMPLQIQVTPLSDSSFGVEWSPPYSNAGTVTVYTVNVTMLMSFDPSSIMTTPESNSSQAIVTPHSVQVNVQVTDNQSSSVVVKELTPFTMYEVTVVAKNKHGSSLPSYPVRSLTLTPGKTVTQAPAVIPKLPDVKKCCSEKGITHDTCLNKLCGFSDAETTEVTDLMICAPWANHAFDCLNNGIDHTPCCRTMGLPDICQDLCSGNITQLDFNYFKCIKHIPTYRNCLMQGYGVLPGPPVLVKVTNVDVDFAIVSWEKPSYLPETVVHYNIHVRALQRKEYQVFYEVNAPYILENLLSDTLYEVYVAASNAHGTGEPSQRIVFSTQSKVLMAKLEEAEGAYNLTGCCINSGLSSACMPLCSYDASMSQLKSLAAVCIREVSKLIRCGAGGRNHAGCCSRRGVPPACLPACSGVIDNNLLAKSTCLAYIGNIVQCFEEGTELLPGPISELHAIKVNDNSVTLTWEPPKEGNSTTDYVIYYKKVDNTSMHETVLKLDNQMNSTDTTATISGLDTGNLYNFFVVARNEHGTSLPSSILLINITNTNLEGLRIAGVTSPPHSLAIADRSATYVTITWQPPEFSLPNEQLGYRVFYKANAEPGFQSADTSVTSHTLQNLSPNTQYIVYVTAISKKGQSLPSETFIAWTDPAYPAFVEPPTVHPINLVVEGNSMTILCIAMGTPLPTVSLYIAGRLVRQEVTRHMVTQIHNVTRDMNHISCYADNGFGTPMEARRKIIISYGPHIQASGITMAAHGESVTLECIVDAQPEPKMMFWRDYVNRVPVIQGGGKYEVSISKKKDEDDRWLMQLTIKSITDSDEGDYYCHAENAFGNKTQPVSVRIRNVAAVNNITQCCVEQNVTSPCMDACTFYLDIDSVINKPECIGDFDKLMKCGSDGSDHRSCCALSGVERGCLDWCRGEPLFAQDSKVCLLQHTKRIMSCFREGRERLPGPPQNVRVERIDSHSVLVKWDPPTKNPLTVEMYRVFWRQAGPRNTANKSDSKVNSLKITGLKDGVAYECVLKAGNSRGTSTLTEPVRFTTDDKYITSAASLGEEHSQVGMAVGLVLALLLVAVVVVAVVWFVRSRSLLGNKSSNGVAFENPSYLREVNMDHIQVSQLGDSSSASATLNQSGWKQEQLHVPSSTEVAPSIYEELKLGSDGVGFKRLKP